jgi:hypothetical protein
LNSASKSSIPSLPAMFTDAIRPSPLRSPAGLLKRLLSRHEVAARRRSFDESSPSKWTRERFKYPTASRRAWQPLDMTPRRRRTTTHVDLTSALREKSLTFDTTPSGGASIRLRLKGSSEDNASDKSSLPRAICMQANDIYSCIYVKGGYLVPLDSPV